MCSALRKTLSKWPREAARGCPPWAVWGCPRRAAGCRSRRARSTAARRRRKLGGGLAREQPGVPVGAVTAENEKGTTGQWEGTPWSARGRLLWVSSPAAWRRGLRVPACRSGGRLGTRFTPRRTRRAAAQKECGGQRLNTIGSRLTWIGVARHPLCGTCSIQRADVFGTTPSGASAIGTSGNSRQSCPAADGSWGLGVRH